MSLLGNVVLIYSINKFVMSESKRVRNSLQVKNRNFSSDGDLSKLTFDALQHETGILCYYLSEVHDVIVVGKFLVSS